MIFFHKKKRDYKISPSSYFGYVGYSLLYIILYLRLYKSYLLVLRVHSSDKAIVIAQVQYLQ